MDSVVENIWYQFHDELRGFILKKVGNQSDTDDILQEAFIKIMQNFEKVSEAKNIKAYIYGIVKNSIFDFFRTQKNKTLEINDNLSFSEEEDASLNDTISLCCLEPFILLLPEIYKEALLFTEVNNGSQKELAKKLNISYSGAKSRVQRAKLKLKEVIIENLSLNIKPEIICLTSSNNECNC